MFHIELKREAFPRQHLAPAAPISLSKSHALPQTAVPPFPTPGPAVRAVLSDGAWGKPRASRCVASHDALSSVLYTLVAFSALAVHCRMSFPDSGTSKYNVPEALPPCTRLSTEVDDPQANEL